MDIEDLDPDIAALLNSTDMEDTETSGAADMDENFPSPDFDFSADEPSAGAGKQEGKVDLTVTKFAPIEKFFSDTPHKVFDDPNYYKTALSGESEIANRLHATLSKFLKTDNPQDRTQLLNHRLKHNLLPVLRIPRCNAKEHNRRRLLYRSSLQELREQAICSLQASRS